MLDNDKTEQGQTEFHTGEQGKAEAERDTELISILESISDTFMAINRDWRIAYINQHGLNILGLAAKAIIGRNLWEAFPQLLGSALETAYRRAMDEQIAVQFETQGVPAGRWYDMRIYPSGGGISIYGLDITERKQAVEALHISEERFRKAFQVSPDILAISRQADGYIYEVNEHWEKFFGYRRAEVIGHTTLDLKLYMNQADRENMLNQMQTQGFVRDFKANLRNRAGKIHYTSISVESIVIDDNACWLAIIRDLTERKLAEERFQQIVEYAPNGIVMVDLDGQIRLVNTQVERLFGYQRTELLEQQVEILIPSGLRGAHVSYRHDFMAQTVTRPMGAGRDLVGLHKEGHTIPMEISLHPIETMQGNLVLCTIIDISLRKRAEAILQQSEERLRLATDAGKIGIFDYDIGADCHQFSPIFYAITQFPPAAPTRAEDWLTHVYPEDRPLVKKTRQWLMETGLSSQFEYRIVWPDQTIRWVEVSLSTTKDAQNQPIRITGALRDITEHKQIEGMLRSINKTLEQRVMERTAQLEASNKELEAYTYSVSHDLRAPLRAIDSFSNILLEEHAAELTSKPRHYLQRIHHNAKQMGQLIDDLLTFSQLSRQPLQKRTVAPALLVEQALTDLSHEQEGRRVEITLADLPTCLADPNLLRQVFANLLANALKYTRKRDVATIEIGWQSLSEQDPERKGPIYFIRDNGVGFDMRYASKLFGVFQRLHANTEYEGTGVGLATVQRIILRHGGQIWAQAEVDKGATFYFSLGGDEPGGADASG